MQIIYFFKNFHNRIVLQKGGFNMTKLRLHEDCKILSQVVYKKEKPKSINGWEYVDKYFNNTSGYYSELYKKDKKVILITRGTELSSGKKEAIKDLKNDINMGIEKLPYQVTNAKEVYSKLVKKYGKENIIVTGHSLGGSISEILGTEYGVETVTFNAYGIKKLNGLKINYTDNITNYGNANDGIFVSNIDNHVGKIMILNVKGEGNYFKKSLKKPNFFKDHPLEKLTPLSEAKEYKKEYFEKYKTPLFKVGIEHVDYRDDIFDIDNRVLYTNEINPDEDDKELVDAYIKQFSSNKSMPSKEELDKKVHIGNLIYVEDYTRSDGTKVSGYYRRFK